MRILRETIHPDSENEILSCETKEENKLLTSEERTITDDKEESRITEKYPLHSLLLS